MWSQYDQGPVQGRDWCTRVFNVSCSGLAGCIHLSWGSWLFFLFSTASSLSPRAVSHAAETTDGSDGWF